MSQTFKAQLLSGSTFGSINDQMISIEKTFNIHGMVLESISKSVKPNSFSVIVKTTSMQRTSIKEFIQKFDEDFKFSEVSLI